MDFEIEDSGEDQDFSNDYNYNRGSGSYGKHSYASGGKGGSSSNSGVRRSTGSGFFSAGNDQDGDDYDFEYEDTAPAAPSSGRIAAFSPAAVNRKGNSGGNSKDFDVSSDYESSHDNYSSQQPQQRGGAKGSNSGLRLSVTSQESALEKAQNMLNRYSQKNKPSTYNEPATNFKAKKSTHFDEDDLSMDEDLEEDDEEEADEEAYMDISDSVDRSREKFSKSKAPSSGGGMGLKKSPATTSLLPSSANNKPSATGAIANKTTQGNVGGKSVNKMMDDSNVSHIVHEESVHDYEDEEDGIGEEGESVEDDYGDEEFDKNEEDDEDELGESIAQDDDEEPTKKKASTQSSKQVHVTAVSSKASKDYDEDYEDGNDDEANDNASYSRMVYGQEDDVESIEGDEDYTEASKPKIFSFTDLGDVAGWEPAASTNNVFNDISHVSKPDPVIPISLAPSNLKPAGEEKVIMRTDTTAAPVKNNIPTANTATASIPPSISNNKSAASSTPSIPIASSASISQPQPTAVVSPPLVQSMPLSDPSQIPVGNPQYYPYHQPYYPSTAAAPAVAQQGNSSAVPAPTGYPAYPYPPMPLPPFGYPPYGYYPPMPPLPAMPPAYGYPPYSYPPPYAFPPPTSVPTHDHIYAGLSPAQSHNMNAVMNHTLPNPVAARNSSISASVPTSVAALSSLGNQPIVLELLKELSKVQEEANWARTKLAETLLILKETGQSLPSRSIRVSSSHQQQVSPHLSQEHSSTIHQSSKPLTTQTIGTQGRYGNTKDDDRDDEYSEEYSEDFDVSQLNLSTSYRGSRRNSPTKNNSLNANSKADSYEKLSAGGNKKPLPPPMPQLREEDGDDIEDSRSKHEVESKTSPHAPTDRINPQLANSVAFGGRFSSFHTTDPFADTLARSFMASQELLRTKLDSLRLKIQMSNKMSIERDEIEEFTVGKNIGTSLDQPGSSSLNRLKMQFETKRKQNEDRLKQLLVECYPDLDEEEVMKMAKLVE